MPQQWHNAVHRAFCMNPPGMPLILDIKSIWRYCKWRKAMILPRNLRLALCLPRVIRTPI